MALLACGPVAAQDAIAWLQEGVGLSTRVMSPGEWTPAGGLVHATDPLTLWQTGPDATLITVPEAPARVIGLIDREYGRSILMALVWSDAPVVCGEDLGTIGVDTGLAGFLTPADVAALEAYADPSLGTYHGTYADQLEAEAPTVPLIAELPDGSRFPVSGSGWGDGGYPVASLRDASGAMVAVYAQFDTGTDDWLLPVSCGQASHRPDDTSRRGATALR
ncbi:hypothetical protein [Roseicyclus mahoneyensis]|uniref:hypothetical protein n=1 Tax=Roseicyclus mahoneyensis TaxID=164332 RepID=UPI0011B1E159|nr:hypothetical protein [Roseicyclus mahoneyensis]